MAKKYPDPPNPTTVIGAQTGSNIDTAKANATLNRITQNTPYGSSQYSITGQDPQGIPQYQQDITFSPQEQRLFDLGTSGQIGLGETAQGMLGQVRGAYANPIDTSGAPGIASNVPGGPIGSQIAGAGNVSTGIAPTQTGIAGSAGTPSAAYGQTPQTQTAQNTINTGGLPGIASQVNGGYDTNAAIKQAQDAAYKSQTQYLDPQYQQGQAALENQLANQGTVKGSQAYNDAVNNYALQKQRAYQSAQNSATLAGNQEQNVLFGQGLSQAELQNQANQQGFGQLFGLGQFYNQAQNQNFGQGLAATQQQNALRQQQLQEGLASGAFQNQAQQQEFGQNLAGSAFGNEAQQQQFGQNAAQLAAQNQAQSQGFGQGTTNAQLQNQAQQQYLQQLFALRNQPLNEYNALATGAQVQQPSFNQVPGVQQAGTNVAGIYQNNFDNQMQIAQQKNAFWNNLMGLGGSLGAGALIGGYI